MKNLEVSKILVIRNFCQAYFLSVLQYKLLPVWWHEKLHCFELQEILLIVTNKCKSYFILGPYKILHNAHVYARIGDSYEFMFPSATGFIASYMFM